MKTSGQFSILLVAFLLAATVGCGSTGLHNGSVEKRPPQGDFGVLVMAHGGSGQWNQGVLETVGALRGQHPVEVAFGMADAESMQAAVARLEEAGVERIGVVRLFVSGESFLERTEKILGLAEGAPAKSPDDGADSAPKMDHGPMSMAFWRVETKASFALSHEGLSEGSEIGAVLVARAKALSTDPGSEDVLILAHGPGDDEENERWLRNIRARVAGLSDLGFRRVEVQTLREDWEGKRKLAEQEIRGYVQRASQEGGQAIVIPFRVHGFGPYKGVLEGLDYVSDGIGLIPHPAVGKWIARQAAALREGPFTATAQ